MPSTYTHRAMNCQFTISFADSEDADTCRAASSFAFERIDGIERLLSAFNDTSDVAVIKSLKPGEVAVVAPETMDVLIASATVCAATGGAFDPTLAPVMNLLRERSMNWDAVPDNVLEDAFARCGMQRLVIDKDNMRVSVTEDRWERDTPVELDFGGIGKGFAVDECGKTLRGPLFEIKNFLIDAGSSTVAVSGETPQRLGVGGQWKKRTRLPSHIDITNGALSASGFETVGRHVVDPRGFTGASTWEHVWVVAPSAATADALSTAALSMSEKEISRAARETNSDFLTARGQSSLFDKLRDPLKWIKGFQS